MKIVNIIILLWFYIYFDKKTKQYIKVSSSSSNPLIRKRACLVTSVMSDSVLHYGL